MFPGFAGERNEAQFVLTTRGRTGFDGGVETGIAADAPDIHKTGTYKLKNNDSEPVLLAA